MEVHAHSHTPRKKWTHYFWEFLMLFLAVFCGFLAEYQLEHKIEKDRERQYIRSLVSDIKHDIGQLEELNKEWDNSFKTTDTLLKMLAGKDIYTNSGPAFMLVGQSTGFTDFVPNDGTIEQLKNSGGLRLLRKSRVTDSIMAYQRSIDRVLIKQAGMNEAQQYRNRITELFDVSKIITDSEFNDIPLPASDKKSINSAFMYIVEWRNEFYLLKILGDDIRDCGSRLLKLIDEQYQIK